MTKHTKDELILNSAYQDLEQFYDVVILPPPAGKPKGKATVEKGVQWLETHLLEELKERAYYSLYDPERLLDTRIIEELAKCKWVEEGRNLMVTGQTGSGKSYLANALAICALRQFKTVKYCKASQLIDELNRAEAMDSYREALANLVSFDLLVIDDFGLMQLDLNKCRNLFEVLESRDPGRSTMVVSQFPVKAWYNLFQEHTYADACLNRLLHNSYRLEMNGKNMRDLTPLNK